MGNVMHVPSRFYPSCRYSIPHPAGRSYPAGGEQVQWWASSAFRQFFNCNTTQLYILHLQYINVTYVTFYNNSIFPCKTTHLGGNSIFAKTTAYLLLQQQPHQLLFNQYRKRSIRLVIGLGGDMGVAGRVINGRHDCMSFL